jgi:hypothetical protein
MSKFGSSPFHGNSSAAFLATPKTSASFTADRERSIHGAYSALIFEYLAQ